MLRTKRYTLSIITVLCLNILYFLWQTYPKHFLPLSKPPVLLADFITNVIYFCIYIFCLVCIAKPVNTHLSLKKYIGITGLLLAVQLGFDLINMMGRIFSYYVLILNDVCSILCFIISWIILCKLFQLKIQATKKKSILFITGGLMILFVSLSIVTVFNIFTIHEIQVAVDKFSSLESISQMIQNRAFIVQIRSLILEIIVSVCIIIISFELTNRVDDKDICKDSYKRGQLFLRVVAIIIGTFFIFGIKLLILPFSAIGKTTSSSHHSQNMIPQEEFDLDLDETVIERATGYSTNEAVYAVSNIDIYYANERLLSFKMDYVSPVEPVDLHSGNVVMQEPFVHLPVESVDAQMYRNYAIMFVEDSVPRALLLKDINTCKESAMLTKICEAMIEKKNWNFFECAYLYLLKNDPDFIEPYIKRYSKGEFTNDELNLNKDINAAYIQKLAQYVNVQ